MSWLDDELVSSSSGNFTIPEDLQVNGNATVDGWTALEGQVAIGKASASPEDKAYFSLYCDNLTDTTQYGHVVGAIASTDTLDANVTGTWTSYLSHISSDNGARTTGQFVDYWAQGGILGSNHNITRRANFVGDATKQATVTSFAVLTDDFNSFDAGDWFICQTGTYDSLLYGDIRHAGSGYGFVHDTGLWEDLHTPASGINPNPGIGTDPGVSTVTGLFLFDASSIELVGGAWQMPHAWKSESNTVPHAHLMSDAGTDPRAAATATAADGVCAGGTVYLTSVTGGFTGHANEYLVITVTGTNSQAVVASYQIASIVSDTNVELVSDPTAGGTADDSVTWAIYPDTVAIQFDYAIIAVDGSWDQSTYSSELIHVQLAAHVGGDAVLQENDFATLDMTGFQDEAHIFWKFSRVGDNGNDTYGADMHFAALGLNYRRNTMGSLAEGGEDF